MSRTDFHFEFNNEVDDLDPQLIADMEERIAALADEVSGIIGSSMAVEEIAHGKTPHLFRARVVIYIRPENIAVVKKAETAVLALREATGIAEQQVRQDRTRRSQGWKASDTVTRTPEIRDLTPEELYHTYAPSTEPADLIELGRTELANRLIRESKLDRKAAFFVADQLLLAAEERQEAA